MSPAGFIKINSISFRGNLAAELEASTMAPLHRRGAGRLWVTAPGQSSVPTAAWHWARGWSWEGGGCWVWSHESHPCSQTHSPELPAGQGDALFCWIPPFPHCAPQGQMVSRGIQSLGTFPGGAAMDGGTCCETLRPQRSIAQHKAIYITIKGAYRLELVTLKCLSRSINWVTKYVNASVLYRQRKFLH